MSLADQKAGLTTMPRRFASLLSESICPRTAWDEILLEVDDCVVAPTLGSIVPNWLLVIPRARVLNFARWRTAIGVSPNLLVSNISGRCGWGDNRVIWFEHGAEEYGSKLACGVDQAHLHLLIDAPFSFDKFVSAAADAALISWRNALANQAYSSIQIGAPYLLLASGNHSVFAQDVERVGSQFLRRVIADLVGRSCGWDYKQHPHIENVRRTVDTVRQALNPPRR